MHFQRLLLNYIVIFFLQFLCWSCYLYNLFATVSRIVAKFEEFMNE